MTVFEARAQEISNLENRVAYEEDPGMFKVLKALLMALRADHSATTALEYGLIAGVLGLVLIAIFHNFGAHLTTLFSVIGRSL